MNLVVLGLVWPIIDTFTHKGMLGTQIGFNISIINYYIILIIINQLLEVWLKFIPAILAPPRLHEIHQQQRCCLLQQNMCLVDVQPLPLFMNKLFLRFAIIYNQELDPFLLKLPQTPYHRSLQSLPGYQEYSQEDVFKYSVVPLFLVSTLLIQVYTFNSNYQKMENAQQIQPKIVKANQILESKKIINHNGFTKTPPITQIIPPIAAIISFLLCLIQIFIMFQKIGERIILSSIIIGLLLINSVLWYMTTKIIPTDSVQLKHIQSIKNNESFDGENSCFCKLCETYVGNHSFHCKKCNRCVQFFDHHCKWLNNCIGAKNYFEFYALVISIFIFLTYCLALSVYFSKRTIEHFHEQLVSVQIFFAFGLFISFLSLVPIGFLIYLIILHTYLIITKRTTISLILESRNKNKIHPIQHQNPKESLFRLELGAQELIEDSLTKEIKDEKIIFKKIQKNKSAHLVLAENNKIKSIQLNDENSMFNDTNQMMVKSSGSSQKQNRGPLSKQSSLQSSIMNPSDILPPIVNKRIKNKITYQFDKVSTPKKVFESYHIENRNKISNYDRSFVKDA